MIGAQTNVVSISISPPGSGKILDAVSSRHQGHTPRNHVTLCTVALTANFMQLLQHRKATISGYFPQGA